MKDKNKWLHYLLFFLIMGLGVFSFATLISELGFLVSKIKSLYGCSLQNILPLFS